MNKNGITGGVSIVRSDYLTNIKQGALNTLNLGCHLFGFGAGNTGRQGPGEDGPIEEI